MGLSIAADLISGDVFVVVGAFGVSAHSAMGWRELRRSCMREDCLSVANVHYADPLGPGLGLTRALLAPGMGRKRHHPGSEQFNGSCAGSV